METTELLSNEFTVRWNEQIESLVIVHPDSAKFPLPLVQIPASTLEHMSWQEASQFIGERLVQLMPALRERYVDPGTGMLRELSAIQPSAGNDRPPVASGRTAK